MFNLPVHMIENYIQRRSTDFGLLKTSLANNEIDEFNRIGHQLLGNCSNFGFAELEPLAKKMDELKAEELSTRGPELLAQYSSWLDQNLKKLL